MGQGTYIVLSKHSEFRYWVVEPGSTHHFTLDCHWLHRHTHTHTHTHTLSLSSLSFFLSHTHPHLVHANTLFITSSKYHVSEHGGSYLTLHLYTTTTIQVTQCQPTGRREREVTSLSLGSGLANDRDHAAVWSNINL